MLELTYACSILGEKKLQSILDYPDLIILFLKMMFHPMLSLEYFGFELIRFKPFIEYLEPLGAI